MRNKLINLKEDEILKDNYDLFIDKIKELNNPISIKSGLLSEFMCYLYYTSLECEYRRIDKNLYPNKEDLLLFQERLGDYFIFPHNKGAFTIDVKNGHCFNQLPKLALDLEYRTKDCKPYYGTNIIREDNYGWFYRGSYGKIFVYFNDLNSKHMAFIIEDYESFKNTIYQLGLVNKTNMQVNKNKIDSFNKELSTNAVEVAWNNKDKCKNTKFLSILLSEKIINSLGSDLTIVEFKY